jgi:NAD(P)-dependent dehydrogenase (short-subunit alcohol dehydrogenase family)
MSKKEGCEWKEMQKEKKLLKERDKYLEKMNNEDQDTSPASKEWRFDTMHDQEGKVFLVTGANAGLGYQTTRHLVRCNAQVIMACRSKERGQAALDEIKKEFPKANLVLRIVDLVSNSSIQTFATGILNDFPKLDCLVNNAGIGWIPHVILNDVGCEQTIATNCVGPFLLTGLLLPLLLKTPNSRIVTVVSTYAFKVDSTSKEDLADTTKSTFEDMQNRYFVSKAMNILFAHILEDRLKKAQSTTISVLTHPGFAKTEFADNMEKSFNKTIMRHVIMPLFAQSAEMGAAPLLMAATHDQVKTGDFYGPANEMGGWPHHSTSKITGLADDKDVFGKTMWGWLEEWSKFKFPI